MNKIRLIFFTILACAFQLPSNNTFSQACCTGGIPLSSSLGIKTYPEKSFVIDLSYDINKMDQLYSGTHRLDDSNRKRITKSSILRFTYALNKKWTITTILPYVWQDQTVYSAAGNTSQSSNGIGDIVILGQYTLIQNKQDQFIAAIGPKFPTGSVYKRDKQFEILLPPDLQPGSGSYDIIGAISYSKLGIIKPTLRANAQVSYRYSFEVGRYGGGQKYRFGNELILNLGFTDSFVLAKKVVNPAVFFKYRHTQEDENNDAIFPNTGGSLMYLVPSLDIKITPNLNIHSNLEIPIYTDVVGTQLVTSYRGKFGINYTLNFLSKK